MANVEQKRKRPSFLNLKGGNDGLLNKGNQRKAVALIQTVGQRKSSGFEKIILTIFYTFSAGQFRPDNDDK
ncbi:hypothetical protein QT13_00355 [Pectobacterium brasiliense]|nr:hypothetical protein QT13_00355 [Pectobacterium brasiliense]KHS90406.1 hypothetical protein RC83_00680 [Pectobacterium brasiliense]